MRVEELIREALPSERLVSFSECNTAWLNKVYAITLQDRRVILKIISGEHARERYATELEMSRLARTRVRVPKIIWHSHNTDYYIIEEELKGEQFARAQKTKKLYHELGRTLALLHSIRNPQSRGWSRTFEELLSKELRSFELGRFKTLTERISEYYESRKHLLNVAGDSLLHNDFSADNLIISDGVGVIDFELATWGHNELELAKVISKLLTKYPEHKPKPVLEDFLKGYESEHALSPEFRQRQPLYLLYHLCAWTNHVTKHPGAAIHAGFKPETVLNYFLKDIKTILSEAHSF